MTGEISSLSAYGWSDRWAALFAELLGDQAGTGTRVPGRVVRHDGVAVLVETADGRSSLPVLGSVDPQPVVGDWVVVDRPTASVVATLHRASLLRRRDPHRDVEQPLVANVDAVLIVCGLDRPVKTGRIQRATALAWDAGATPVVVLAKADLCSAADRAAIEAEVVEANPGIDVVWTSTVTGDGLDDVRRLSAERTIVLLGESGAGKSSLTNALIGTTVAGTGDVRSSDAKGRHTTTSRQLHPLPTGGVLVDTPGVRAVGLWVDEDAVAATFDDIETLAEGCRFNDCAHSGEPGCAVVAAIEAGELDPDRLVAWATFRHEVESAARRANTHQQRTFERQFARIVKDAQKRKGRDQPDQPDPREQ